ncbi:MAG TPA: carbohydrate-binding family 9-like protein, partial [Burkholderiales bacterium]|nr:carbohydrate-binding family 9-like protein [Burkholderiales bacterium]
MAPRYEIVRVGSDFEFSSGAAGWPAVPSLTVGHYLWSKNSYAPPVEARLCYNERFLFVRFLVEEGRVRARFTRFQDPVYKDSCVELFVDAFPDLGRGYLNLEANALGTLLAAFGPDRHHRAPLTRDELRGFRAAPSLTSPVDGEIAAGRWTLAYRVPLGLFRKLYGRDIVPGQPAAANFYKCGDETEFPHYGVWSAVGTPTPDFHRPEFFGT